MLTDTVRLDSALMRAIAEEAESLHAAGYSIESITLVIRLSLLMGWIRT